MFAFFFSLLVKNVDTTIFRFREVMMLISFWNEKIWKTRYLISFECIIYKTDLSCGRELIKPLHISMKINTESTIFHLQRESITLTTNISKD